MAVYGYCRVSSKGQEDNTSLLNQERQILERYSDAKITKEVFTGGTGERPKFKKLIKSLKEGDTLVCTKLDRFMRNTVEGLNVAQELTDKGINIHLLDIGLIEKDSAIGELFLTMMLSFATFEKKRISERMAEGMKNAIKKNGGEVRGRKRTSEAKKEHVILLYKQGNSWHDIIDKSGLSRGSIAKIIKEYKEEQQKAEEEAAAKLQSGQILEQKEIDVIIEKGQQKFCK